MSDFKPGDVVRLKSGGPRMTVNTEKGDGTIYCEWFAEAGECTGQSFSPEMLEHLDSDHGQGELRRM